MNDKYGPRRRADRRVVSAQERCEQHYANVLGNLIVSRADDVEDMARRVVDVLGGNPRDHHYAVSKLSYAMTRCAEALAIAGWTEAEIVTPRLTTVHQPLAEIGRMGVSLLTRLLENQRLEALHVELQTKLVKRGSTAPPRASGRHGV